MKQQVLYTGLEVLDHQLIDVNGRNVGKVDDLEFIKKGNVLILSSLLVGSAAWIMRLPIWMQRVVRFFIKHPSVTKIPISDVLYIDGSVHLTKPAKILGLGKGDDVVGLWLNHIPGA